MWVPVKARILAIGVHSFLYKLLWTNKIMHSFHTFGTFSYFESICKLLECYIKCPKLVVKMVKNHLQNAEVREQFVTKKIKTCP